MRLLITKHAKERMADKATSKEMIIEAIKKGAKIKQTNGYLASYGYIKVAYKIIDKDYYKIKTVFIE
ncbi:DUF4258 domain-containing protein [Candidatus Woesearchaeota archaeon]|nr:DUF4258 domain-containing protein [Candidatus Woesearchaeota archaeon]